MYPYELFWGIDLYQLMISAGFLAALLFFRYWGDRRDLTAGVQNLVIVSALLALIGGYGASVLVQALYNALETGVFEINAGTGATFYGGLIGGAAVFLIAYFVAAKWILKKEPVVASFWTVAEIAGGSISLAHALGRLGCLFAGCCHGKVTDAWYGVYNVYLGCKTVPVQLYESLFLFLLAGVIFYRLKKRKTGNLSLYLWAYAVWRFAAEFMRADDRGASPVPFLTPSQFTAVLLTLIGIGVFFLERFCNRPKGAAGDV